MLPTAGPSADAIAAPMACEPDLADLARPVAASARILLAANRAALLSLTMLLRQDDGLVAMCWHGPLVQIGLAATLDLNRPVLRRAGADFETAGARLIEHVARRWPPNAVPPAIGIVTDGEGLAFSPDHPSPLAPDWLALHRARRCTPTELLAFGDRGGWALLTAEVAHRRVH